MGLSIQFCIYKISTDGGRLVGPLPASGGEFSLPGEGDEFSGAGSGDGEGAEGQQLHG
jgi:hypothetical protein